MQKTNLIPVEKLNGTYHNFRSLISYLRENHFYTLAKILEDHSIRQVFQGEEWITRQETQTFITPRIYRVLSCEITTYLI